MTPRLVLLAALAVLTACSQEPPSGSCKGAIGATKLDVAIDESSESHRIRPEACGGTSRDVYTFRYGGGALAIRAVTKDTNGFTKNEPRTIPSSPDPSQFIEAWDVSAPKDRPAFSAGEATFEFVIGGRMKGTFLLDFEDSSKVECTFEVPVDTELDEGPELDCGDSDDGDDDWD